MEGSGKAKVNRIGLADGILAVTWLQQRAEEAARRPQGEVASALAEHLGRPVTVQNLQTIAAAAGVRLHGYGDVASGRLEERLEQLQGLAEKLSLALGNVTGNMTGLAERVGRLERAVGPVPAVGEEAGA